jgi:hypothetical protein
MNPAARLSVGQSLWAKEGSRWWVAKVVNVNPDDGSLLVTFVEWSNRKWDRWYPARALVGPDRTLSMENPEPERVSKRKRNSELFDSDTLDTTSDHSSSTINDSEQPQHGPSSRVRGRRGRPPKQKNPDCPEDMRTMNMSDVPIDQAMGHMPQQPQSETKFSEGANGEQRKRGRPPKIHQKAVNSKGLNNLNNILVQMLISAAVMQKATHFGEHYLRKSAQFSKKKICTLLTRDQQNQVRPTS